MSSRAAIRGGKVEKWKSGMVEKWNGGKVEWWKSREVEEWGTLIRRRTDHREEPETAPWASLLRNSDRSEPTLTLRPFGVWLSHAPNKRAAEAAGRSAALAELRSNRS